MLDIVSFNRVLKFTWIKKYLDKDNFGKWKIFFDLEVDSYGKELAFISNMSKRDVSKYVNLSDPFINLKKYTKHGRKQTFEDTITCNSLGIYCNVLQHFFCSC